MSERIYKTKAVPEIPFEVYDYIGEDDIEEQIQIVKDIVFDRVNDDFKKLQIAIKDDLNIELTNEEKLYKNYVITKKPIDN